MTWIKSEEAQREFFNDFDDLDFTEEISQPNSQQILNKIKERLTKESVVDSIAHEHTNHVPQLSATRGNRKRYLFAKIAASIILIVTSAFVIGDLIYQKSESQIIAQTDTGLITKRTESGQKLTIHLGDGSVAILNSNSSVTYPREFGDTRLVKMTGEVFYEVAKDTEKPFVVKTSLLSTTALGTSFNINTYTDGKNEVTLLTGKVNVESLIDPAKSAILLPGDRVVTEKESTNLIKEKVDLKNQALWKDGVIYFDNTPFYKGIEVLEMWYGVDIRFENLPKEEPEFTGKFKNDYLSNVLNSLSYTMDFRYQIEDKKVLIKFNSSAYE
ncbi:MAG: FecR domain-containing protein [Cyclobacteriaceae bacterium]